MLIHAFPTYNSLWTYTFPSSIHYIILPATCYITAVGQYNTLKGET